MLMDIPQKNENVLWYYMVYIWIALFGLIGAFANLYTFYVLTRVKIDSKVTRALFKAQCLIDCFTCIVAVIYRLTPRAINTRWWLTDTIFCHIWYADNLFWLGSIFSVHGMVCQSFDRLMAVVKPVFYRTHQRGLLITCLTYISCFPTLTCIPNCLLRFYSDQKCQLGFAIQSKGMPVFYYYEGYSWVITSFLAPTAFVITAHAVICFEMYRSNRVTSAADCLERKNARDRIVWRKLKRVLLTTTLMVANVSVCRAWDVIYFLLAHISLITYLSGSLEQMIGILFGTIGSTLGPLILALTSRSIGDFICRQLSFRNGRKKQSK